jgi:hypothetical protein
MNHLPEQAREPVIPGEAGPRLTAAIGRVLARELPLALRAARQIRRRPALALAVLTLASIAFLSSVFTHELFLRQLDPGYRPSLAYDRAREGYSDQTFWQRWWHTYEWNPGEPLIFKPLRAFRSPLGPATGVADGWIGLPAASFVSPRREMGPWRAAPYTILVAALRTVVHVLIFVALVGWIKDPGRQLALADLRRYWRAYYGPVLAVGLVGLAAWAALEIPIAPWWFGIVRVSFAAAVAHAITVPPAVALMLAPFVVVGCGVGAWKGIVEGLRHSYALRGFPRRLRSAQHMGSSFAVAGSPHLTQPQHSCPGDVDVGSRDGPGAAWAMDGLRLHGDRKRRRPASARSMTGAG